MTNQQAAALRTAINALAVELENTTGVAPRRAIKLRIRSLELQLTEG